MDEQLAQQFHEAYERLAPQFSYETRKASAKPWAEVPDNNKQLMRAVMSEVMLPLLATEYDRGKVEVFERMVKVYETYPGWKTIKKIMESKPVDADALFSWIETMDTELAHEIGKLEDELKSKGESKQ